LTCACRSGSIGEDDGSCDPHWKDDPLGQSRHREHSKGELAHFAMGLHHVITESLPVGRLCVLMVPGFISEVP